MFNNIFSFIKRLSRSHFWSNHGYDGFFLYNDKMLVSIKSFINEMEKYKKLISKNIIKSYFNMNLANYYITDLNISHVVYRYKEYAKGCRYKFVHDNSINTVKITTKYFDGEIV